ncbi:peptidoglycan editing factor PgeF [Shewanella psychrotolerans]|uniref:peptidoglycan editing factor PgeF n=1 Tax=Shewanella psychrotolerans TaxID=2864206 RepID=UPI001C659C7E|nr:peptidoglycan editing factor PgeF [Shewanella psychrotolerans]QYK02288.1 peptidoglycan editing factor PgeF [Shewanella psychrotolerans]
MSQADWFVPKGVKFAFTERTGGVSQPPFDSLNFGTHVGDQPSLVLKNRQRLLQQLSLSSEPAWLEQVHGTEVVNLDTDSNRTADASFCRTTNHTCVVMTADCLPVLICDKSATQVAAVHAGWRGLCDGIIEKAVSLFDVAPNELCVYLGPCIGANAFEVGAEVRQLFIDKHPQSESFFILRAGKYLADLQGIARYRTQLMGVNNIYNLPHCTYELKDRYFSYRREPVTGRMASLIWLEK